MQRERRLGVGQQTAPGLSRAVGDLPPPVVGSVYTGGLHADVVVGAADATAARAAKRRAVVETMVSDDALRSGKPREAGGERRKVEAVGSRDAKLPSWKGKDRTEQRWRCDARKMSRLECGKLG